LRKNLEYFDEVYYDDSDEKMLDAVHCPYPSKVGGTCAKFTYEPFELKNPET
jgi:hypothetical protein